MLQLWWHPFEQLLPQRSTIFLIQKTVWLMTPEIRSYVWLSMHPSFDAAMAMIAKLLRQEALLAKCNIKFAFGLLLVHPNDFELLGFTFEGTVLL